MPFSRLSQQRGSRKDAIRRFWVPFPPRCPAHVSAGALVDETKAAAPRGLHIPDRAHRDFLFFFHGDPVGSGLPTPSQCAARLRLVNQSTCGHVRRTQRGKWRHKSSDCVLSTAALLGKTRERQPAHSRPRDRRIGIVRSALALSRQRAGTFTKVPRETQISV